jgi:hypothetical protein
MMRSALIAFLLGIVFFLPRAAVAQDTEVRRLLNERRDVLRALLKNREIEYRSKLCPLERLLRTYRELQAAELAAAITPAERLGALERLLIAVAEQDDIVVGDLARGHATTSDCLAVRAERLEAEIELRRAGGKPPASVKPAREIKAPPAPKE